MVEAADRHGTRVTATDFANGVTIDETHLVIINAIIVSDSTVNSAAGLNPPLTTNRPPSSGNGGGGGGAFGFLSLFGLLLACHRRIRYRSLV